MTGPKPQAKSAADSRTEPARTCILVSGMHRSGTSMVTGIFRHLGCAAPKTLMPANFFNETGYYESEPIAHLNDRILAAAGLSWDSWKSINPDWFTSEAASAFRDEAYTLLTEEFEGASLFALKDPRLSHLLPFWTPVFEALRLRVVTLHICRHPINVAASLTRRDGFSPDYGQLLWLRNVLEAERSTRDMPRLFCRYETVLSDWKALALALEAQMDIEWPVPPASVEEQIAKFINPDLMHFSATGPAYEDLSTISALADDTYEILSTWAQNSEAVIDHARLDDVLRTLDAMLTPVGSLLSSELLAHKALHKAQAKIITLEQNMEEVEKKNLEKQAQSEERLARIEEARRQSVTALEHTVEEEQLRTKYWKESVARLESEAEKQSLDRQTQEIRHAHLVNSLRQDLASSQRAYEDRLAKIEEAERNKIELMRARHSLALRDLRDQLTRQREETAKASAEEATRHRELEEHNATLRAEIERQNAELSALQHQREALIGSSSWRVTRPFRVLKRGLTR